MEAQFPGMGNQVMQWYSQIQQKEGNWLAYAQVEEIDYPYISIDLFLLI